MSESMPGSPPLASSSSSLASVRPVVHSSLTASLATHPLLLDSHSTTTTASGQLTNTYAVYQSSAKRGSSSSPSSTPSGNTPPSSSSAFRSTSTTTPASPSRHHLPPIVSSHDDDAPHPTLTRTAARSISEAREKLNGQNLRATLGELGLTQESVGSFMVLKVASMSGDASWKGVWEALNCGKTTLLLPCEKMQSSHILTPAFFLDHLLVDRASTSANADSIGIATLSGLRGTRTTDGIVISSAGTALVESTSKLVTSGFTTVAPDYTDPALHSTLCGMAYPSSSFASTSSYIFPTFISSLPATSLSIPRPSTRPYFTTTETARPNSTTGSRLAALFSKTPVTPTPTPPVSPPTELASSGDQLDAAVVITPSSRREVPNLSVRVLPIDKAIRHVDVIKSISKTLEQHLRTTLRGVEGIEGTGGGENGTIVEKLVGFVTRFQPPLTWTTAFSPPNEMRSSSSMNAAAVAAIKESFFTRDIEGIADAWNELIEQVRSDLTRNITSEKIKEKRRREGHYATTGEHVDGVEEDEEANEAAMDALLDRGLERIEEVVIVAVYDRLFSPSGANDAQLDENLATRIKALNQLELSLEHLGVELGGGVGASQGWDTDSRTMRDSLEDIIGIAGKELARLQDPTVRSPRDKLTVFINLHKIVVEGLSALPPVPLKESRPDAMISRPPSYEVEMDDAASKRRGRAQSRSSLASSHSIDPSLSPSVPNSELSSVFDSQRSTTTTTTSTLASSSSTSSADLILPLLIYLVVQYNPPHLVSHLLFCQRFRSNALMGGEASYCATSISAVIEFITQVDMKGLGLTPTTTTSSMATVVVEERNLIQMGNRPRGKTIIPMALTAELDRFVDTANHGIVNVVDSSFGLLYRAAQGLGPKTLEEARHVLDGAGTVASRAKGSLLRRTSAPLVNVEKGGGGQQREMVDIPPDGELPTATSTVVSSTVEGRPRSLTASVRALVGGGGGGGDERPSIGDRLASLSRFGGGSSSGSVTPVLAPSFESPHSTTTTRTVSVDALPRPVARLCGIEFDALKMSDVKELLMDYQRIANELLQLSSK